MSLWRRRKSRYNLWRAWQWTHKRLFVVTYISGVNSIHVGLLCFLHEVIWKREINYEVFWCDVLQQMHGHDGFCIFHLRSQRLRFWIESYVLYDINKWLWNVKELCVRELSAKSNRKLIDSFFQLSINLSFKSFYILVLDILNLFLNLLFNFSL